jgi:lysyl-tRNA synthetase class II
MSQEELKKIREKKLERIKKALICPYPSKVKRTHKISDAIENFTKLAKKKEEIFFGREDKIFENSWRAKFFSYRRWNGKNSGFIKKKQSWRICLSIFS